MDRLEMFNEVLRMKRLQNVSHYSHTRCLFSVNYTTTQDLATSDKFYLFS